MDNFDNTEVYRTQNGGSTWEHAGTITMEMGVRRAKFLSAGTIWAIGISTSRSLDSGLTWNSWNWFSPVLAGQKRFVARDIEVLGADNVWLVGNAFTGATDNEGMLLRTSNSGQDWWPDLEVASSGFQALSVVSGKAWIAGMGGLIMHLDNIVSGVDTRTATLPGVFTLYQNYPNPFNSSTVIEYNLSSYADVTLEVFDLLGRRVRTLVRARQDAGPHSVRWDGMNDASQGVTSGVYIYRIVSGGTGVSRRMIALR
jgi:hypothetical protein